MEALMQDYPLTVQHILWRIDKLFHRKEVITKRESGLHRYTYRELVPRVHQLAHALAGLGVGTGDRVATLAFNNYRHLELYYAVPCMGGVLHTLNPRLPLDQLVFIVNDAEDKVLFVDEALLPLLQHLAGKLPSVEHVVVMSDRRAVAGDGERELLDYETLIGSEPTQYPWPRLDERQAAGMCYTSGTTGNPKGVVYSHRSQFLHTMSVVSGSNFASSERDVLFPMVPMFHVNSWGIPYGAGMSGANLVFPDRWMGDGQAIVELAAATGTTLMCGVPTIWMAILQALKSGARLPELRFAFCGGSALPASLRDGLKEYGVNLLQGWGMTETSPVCTVSMLRSWQPQAGPEAERLILSIGAPIPAVEVRIADLSTGDELPWDGVAFGEIQVRGPYIASGYYHDADSDKLTADGWFRTGDVATINPDGFASIIDRTKDVIKSGGEWISSLDLENAIMGHPAVKEAAVVGLSHPKWQERPVAYVVAADPNSPPSLDEVREFLLQQGVARWWLPDDVRYLGEIPKTSVGKFDKKVIRASAEPLRVEEGAS